MLPEINFAQIRPYGGDRRHGFEQLSAELFARDSGVGRAMVRIDGAGGDGGIEAYAELASGGKRALQAKYLFRLGSSQWKQIDASVKRAIKQHRDLTEYLIVVPLDRTPAECEKWRQKLVDWAKLPGGAAVRILWHGQHEISLALKNRANRDLLYYWFGTPQFDDEIMDRCLTRSIATLGARYQPNRHVDVRSLRDLGAFAHAPESERGLERSYVKIAEACLSYASETPPKSLPDSLALHARKLAAAADAVVRAEYPGYGRPVEPFLTLARQLQAEIEALRSAALDLNEPGSNSRDQDYFDHKLTTVGGEAWRWVECLELYARVRQPCALLLGDAGSGKSHLLAHLARQARVRGQPALLLLGEMFLGTSPPLAQICEQIGWNDGAEPLLSALNVAGSLAGRPTLLIIDALNESAERRLWKSNLQSLADEIRRFEHLRLVVACRSDFEGITLSDDFAEGRTPDGWWRTQHAGFGDALHDAVLGYMSSYNVSCAHFPPLLEEFGNPLFLDTFCQAFEDDAVPEGHISLQVVMERRIARLADRVGRGIDCDPRDVKKAIHSLAECVCEHSGAAIDLDLARTVIGRYSPSSAESRSLYRHLVSDGIIAELPGPLGNPEGVRVRFAFERFSDYFIARGLLADVNDGDSARKLTHDGGTLSWVRDPKAYYSRRGIARAIAILLPELCGLELAELVEDLDHRKTVIADCLESLPWRTSASLGNSAMRILSEAERTAPPKFYDALLRMAMIPSSPLNAGFLDRSLRAMPLACRDSVWTTHINDITADPESGPVRQVEWALQVPFRLVPDEQVSLACILLLWFTSSTRVALRDRASSAAIRLLTERPHLAARLVERFDTTDDPYVVERVYAVAGGVAMRQPAGEPLRSLASTVHRLVFASGNVRPHVLLRDYAQAVLEAALQRDSLAPEITHTSFRPPFTSQMPRIIGSARCDSLLADEGWSDIDRSTRPEGKGGMYGDFGRYVMGTALRHFLAAKRGRPSKSRLPRGFDHERARRWIVQRVESLGWTPGMFADYDSGKHDLSMLDRKKKLERIGKKYQWIALHELLGFLTDHHELEPEWGGARRTYVGAWQIGVRDFDPTAGPAGRDVDEDLEEDERPRADGSWQPIVPYACPFSDQALLADRGRWVRSPPTDTHRLLTAQRKGGNGQALVLEGHWLWREPRVLRIRHHWPGRSEMWVHVRSWLLPEQECGAFLDQISRLQFFGVGCTSVELRDGWMGEYPHGSAFAEARRACGSEDRWTEGVPATRVITACEWVEAGGPRVLSPQLCDLLDASWSGDGVSFRDSRGEVVADSCPLPFTGDSTACIVAEDSLRSALAHGGKQIVWALLGEKRCFDGQGMVGGATLHFSGVFKLAPRGPEGGLTVVDVFPVPHR